MMLCHLTAKVSAYDFTLTRQSLDERGSAYLCYDRVIRVKEGHRSFKKKISIMKLFIHNSKC